MKKVIIHLPNGKKYAMKSTDGAGPGEEEAGALRESFSNANSMRCLVLDIDMPASAEIMLILWGDVFKNSYITIE